jgi:hypothetical protein
LPGLAKIAKLEVDETPRSAQSTDRVPGGIGWQVGVARMAGCSTADITAVVGELQVPISP